MTIRNVEMARLTLAQQTLGSLLSRDQWVPQLSSRDSAADLGRRIFNEESAHPAPDDRRLYWRRLAMQQALAASRVDVTSFEAASRGLSDLAFDEAVEHRVLVTGFDPFHLDTRVDQANPSGVVALQMADRRWMNPAGPVTKPARVQVKSVIVPVRYADFDDQLIENLLHRLLPKLSMVITVSMGRDGFDLERFPGRRRSVDTPDNLSLTGGGSALAPFVPAGPDGPEFIEYTLPASAMMAVKGRYPITDNHQVRTLESGILAPLELSELDGLTAVEGSGGGYLSNEISWRVLNTIRQVGLVIPAGHIHTPAMVGYDAKVMEDIVAQCCAMIEAAAGLLR